MKNLIFVLLISFLFSCENVLDETENTGFQIQIDNIIWQAQQVKAFQNPNGSIFIKVSTANETFDILVPNKQIRTYTLGMSSTVNAAYTYDAEGLFVNYTTGNNIGGSGKLEIKRHPKADTTISISGELTFQGVQTTGNEAFPEKRNFIRGVFYNIPIQITP